VSDNRLKTGMKWRRSLDPVYALFQAYRPDLAALGVCIVLVTLWISLPFNVGTIALVICAAVTSTANQVNVLAYRAAFLPFILVFFVASALSAWWSDVRVGGFISCLDLLQPILIYVVVVYFYKRYAQISAIFIALTILALSLSIAILVAGWRMGMPVTSISGEGFVSLSRDLVSSLQSPVLRVPNDVTLLAVISPLTLALLIETKIRYLRMLAVCALLTGVAVILMIRSRGALLTMIVGLCTFAALYRTETYRAIKRRILGAMACVLVAAFGIDMILGGHFLHRFTATDIDNRISSDGRFGLWWEAWKMFLDAPLLGHGPRSFGSKFIEYFDKFPPPFYLQHRLHMYRTFVPWPHNLYLELLAERGLIGFGLFICTMVIAFKKAWRMSVNEQRVPQLLAAGLFSALAAFAVAGLWELSLIRTWVVTLWLLFLGTIEVLERMNKSAAPPVT
jgi:O-antigen ligase